MTLPASGGGNLAEASGDRGNTQGMAHQFIVHGTEDDVRVLGGEEP